MNCKIFSRLGWPIFNYCNPPEASTYTLVVNSNIHPFFHVSEIKHYIPNDDSLSWTVFTVTWTYLEHYSVKVISGEFYLSQAIFTLAFGHFTR